MWFFLLMWNNVDWPVMKLIFSQVQAQVVMLLTSWVITTVPQTYGQPLQSFCLSVLQWSPLVFILFIGALHCNIWFL
jgi:hypothetical protein